MEQTNQTTEVQTDAAITERVAVIKIEGQEFELEAGTSLFKAGCYENYTERANEFFELVNEHLFTLLNGWNEDPESVVLTIIRHAVKFIAHSKNQTNTIRAGAFPKFGGLTAETVNLRDKF